MPVAVTKSRISEIEKHLSELKAAEKEGDVERLEASVMQLDKVVFGLLVDIYWRQRRMKKQKV